MKRTPTWYVAYEFGCEQSLPWNIERILSQYGRIERHPNFSALERSVALVADVSVPSTDVGIAIDYAVRSGMPTLVVSENRQTIWWPSNPTPNLLQVSHLSNSDLVQVLDDFAKKTIIENSPLTGAYIVVEGMDGCGKTTQFRHLAEYLRSKNLKVLALREPGSTRLGENVRAILLDPEFKELSPETDMLLYQTARLSIFDEVIVPAMRNGVIVLGDRNLMSTKTYQGFGSGLGLQTIDLLSRFVSRRITPDLYILIEVPLEVGMQRVVRGTKDRIESRSMEYFQRVYEGYKEMAKRERNVMAIDGNRTEEQVKQDIQNTVDKFLATEFS